MTTKTITVTEEAYALLSSLKSAQESFSHLFIRIAREKSLADKYFGILKGDVAVAQHTVAELRKKTSQAMGERQYALFGHQRGS